jgi:uncharacterized repeat protein (TIGR02059 family)
MKFSAFDPVVGNTVTIDVTSIVSVSDNVLTLRRTGNFQSNRIVSFNYTQGPINDISTTNTNFQDITGNDLRTISTFPITNGSTVDTEPPVLVTSAPNQPFVSADGLSLTLKYSETLSTTTAAIGNFTVKVGAETRSISSVATSGSTVVLSMAAPIGQGTTTSNPQVTVAYSAPTSVAGTGNSAVQDATGNDAVTFSATNAVNNSTVDITSPVLVTASPNQPKLDTTGTELTLTYNEALSATTAQASNFAVMVSGTQAVVSSVSTSGSTVVLTLSTPVEVNQTVTVTYTAPSNVAGTSNNAIQDTTGNDAGAFSATAVTNNSTVDTTAPVLVTTGSSAPTVSTNGTTLTLTYNEALGASLPSSSSFVIYVNGSPVTVSSVERGTNTSTIVVTLSSPIGKQPGFTVTADVPAIADSAGNSRDRKSVV